MATATFNMGDGPDRRKVADLLTLAGEGATVIGLQEAGDRGHVLDEFLDLMPSWRLWSPKAPGAASVPILYDTDGQRLLRGRSVLGVAARFVGAGAGPSRAKPKAINVVVLRGQGRTRRYVNTHFIASATRSPAPRFRLRRRHYDDHADVLARIIGTGRKMRRTTVTGDFNAEPTSPLLAPIRATGISGWTQVGTHGKRRIDHVLGEGGPRRAVALSSDHRAILGP